jgi:autotransporter-associated beta strand protein
MTARTQHNTIGRRAFLRRSAGATAGLVAAPTALAWLSSSPAALADGSSAADAALAFVDYYKTNIAANTTAATNAGVRALSGMSALWQTGTAWNNGVVLSAAVLRSNMRYCSRVTRSRTPAEAKEAFIRDRQDQSYGSIEGLGPLAPLYRTGALAVTSITSAPDGTPSSTINDAVPVGAPAGASTGAGSTASSLGLVVQLVNTLRGNYASGNPSKNAYQYPRPWRMNEDSEVVDTGTVDAYGFPVYDSRVEVAPQLLLQRSTTPATDGGFPSGHTNAFYLASLAYAYAVPERFQELIASASHLANTRIIAGMHSPTDVVGGRILATALAAATLYDPANASLKAAARAQALAYFTAQTGTTADTLYAFAHSAGPDTDPYAGRSANLAAITPRLTYILPQSGPSDTAVVVPKGAEVLLETRQPYLTADQRREVLRTTALPSGYALIDGPEEWGRLNLFAAADAYGSFDADVAVTLDASAGGFNAADAWRNDIDGVGGLTKAGTGTLTLTGDNSYRGGTTVLAGVLAAGSATAFGKGDVDVAGGALRIAPEAGGLQVHGGYTQATGAVLDVTLARGGDAALTVRQPAVLAKGSVLAIHLDAAQAPKAGDTVPVLEARKLQGSFGTITVDAAGLKAVPVYTASGLSIRFDHA